MNNFGSFTQKPLFATPLGIFGNSKFAQTLEQGWLLAQNHPEILAWIKADQISNGLKKKELRIRDSEYIAKKSGQKNMLEEDDSHLSKELKLTESKVRMPAELVLIFILVRGFFGGLKSKQTAAFIDDSSTLHDLSIGLGLKKVPGLSTILENLNALSEETLRKILETSISEAKKKELDTFKEIYFDSTRIAANSAWPTESRTIHDLLDRVHRSFEIFRTHEIRVNFPNTTLILLKEIESDSKSIALSSGKPGAKKMRQKKYRKIIKNGTKLSKIFKEGLQRLKEKIPDVLPSKKEAFEGLFEWIEVDLFNAELCIDNAKERVLKDKAVPAKHKVHGIADQDADIIPKGTTNPVFGYKPQLGRSEKGFIVSLIMPRGAANDKDQMKAITDQAITTTEIIPSVLSYDDGYTNKKARETYLDLGVKVVSFSGANGKKLLGKDWNKTGYKQARQRRSMVESTMSILKGLFGLNRFSRRGLKAVTSELLEAAICNNIKLLKPG